MVLVGASVSSTWSVVIIAVTITIITILIIIFYIIYLKLKTERPKNHLNCRKYTKYIKHAQYRKYVLSILHHNQQLTIKWQRKFNATYLEGLFAVNLKPIHVLQHKLVERLQRFGGQRMHRLVHQFIKLGVNAGHCHPTVTDDLWNCDSPRRVHCQHPLYQLLTLCTHIGRHSSSALQQSGLTSHHLTAKIIQWHAFRNSLLSGTDKTK